MASTLGIISTASSYRVLNFLLMLCFVHFFVAGAIGDKSFTSWTQLDRVNEESLSFLILRM
jgi:hypothetical protein